MEEGSRVSDQMRSPSGRKLTLRARALRQDQTRERITQAAVELHQLHGPLQTTITAIAERAGVERLTVYRHFPDEKSLHQACQHHFFTTYPLPDLALWRGISPFSKRLKVGIAELYEYWSQTEAMFSSVLRDHEVDPERSGAGAVSFISRASQALLDGEDMSGARGNELHASVAHAVHFYTWRSLVRDQGLSNERAIALMTEFITCIYRKNKQR